ncbi:MAG: DUF1592 domain-containing protein [Planctomycetales bacterium]|nr:DUF1592 domain-containing protein [Planctomycetales bacterium]
MRRVALVLTILAVCILAPVRADEAPKFTPDTDGFRSIAVPYLKEHCLRCHGPDEQEAEFRVDRQLQIDFTDRVAKQHWREVVNVLNSHEMPPEDEPQPNPDQTAAVVEWVTQQMARAELVQRDTMIVLRRLNREEYRNTIRDLMGVDFDPIVFPQDPPAGGFDNNGAALTMSPLHMELYYDAARKVLDQALVTGTQPPSLRWRFEPDSGDSDSNRVTYDGQRVIVNGGRSRVQDGFKVMHHESWDRKLNARDFRLPHEGEYVIRVRAAQVTPNRERVVESARKFLAERRDREIEKNPKRAKYIHEQFENDLNHFRADSMYEYGPPRLKLVQTLGGQPRVLAEFDVDAPLDEPQVYDVRARFTTESAGLTIEYAYSIPKVLENFWMQGHDDFARPELWVDWFELEGPVYAAWPPASVRQVLGDSASFVTSEPDANRTIADELPAAKTAIADFMRRAYRRPVDAAEVEAKVDLFQQARTAGTEYAEAIRSPLIAILMSPHFLYLTEPAADAVGDSNVDGKSHAPRPLTDHELAARLSYLIWSSMPDEQLMSLADAGQLSQPEQLSQQVDRLLADPKSTAFVNNFAGQWLGLREVGANPPAPDLYPHYDRHLETSIVGETEAFFAEILRHDLSVMNFVRSDFVVINERLGRYYGIPGVRGDHFRRVPVPNGVHRGGLVTQAAMLTTTSNGTRTSPVKRGTWVMKNILGIDPGLPVANAGEIAPKVPGIDKATVRQRLEIHRTLPQCARCHNKIDPLGFALENYNAAGQWRDQEGFGYKGRIQRDDPAIDASSKLLDGTEIVGVDGLQTALLERDELFLNCLASKLFTYALGRELGVADQIQVKAAVAHMQQSGDDTLRSLLKFIVTSEPFRTK